MKIKDVQVGQICYTRVSGEQVKVKVVDRIKNYENRHQFVVVRMDTLARLPKARNAAALHVDA